MKMYRLRSGGRLTQAIENDLRRIGEKHVVFDSAYEEDEFSLLEDEGLDMPSVDDLEEFS